MDSERRRSPAEAKQFWELAVDLWSSSGLSVADFCVREGLKESSFYGWQRRLREGSSPSELAPVQSVAEPRAPKVRRRHKRLRLSQDAGSLVPVRLVDDVVPTVTGVATTPKPLSPIEVILPCGARIRVAHGCTDDLLRQVLAALENMPC
jgi:transposase-like protein